MRKGLTTLLDCPFCGGQGVIKKQAASLPELPRPWWQVTCSHDTPMFYRQGKGCPAMPMAIGQTREEAVARWNMRKGKECIMLYPKHWILQVNEETDTVAEDLERKGKEVEDV